MTTIRPELLLMGRTRLENAPRGTKGNVIEGLARQWGISPSRVRIHLKSVGYTSGRKVRSDKGNSGLINSAEVREMAEYLFRSQRKTGKILSDIRTGREDLLRSGRITQAAAKASASTWNRLLNHYGLSKRHLMAPSLATELDALGPNHVHVPDASHGLLMHLTKKGKPALTRVDLLDPAHKPGKLTQWIKRRKLLIRWVLVDYWSGALVVDYRLATGEVATDLIDFLHYCWAPKSNPRLFPFHGKPEILWHDQGSVFKHSAYLGLCDAFNIQDLAHESAQTRFDAPASRATGAVESMMGVWERHFERQWAYEAPEGGLEGIRAATQDYLVRFNSDHAFKVRNTKFTRSQLWMNIEESKLWTVPEDLEDFRSHAISAPAERTVDAYGRITLDGRIFKIEHCDRLIRGERVQVFVNPWDPNIVRVVHPTTMDERLAIYTPTKKNGKTVAAAIIGQKSKKIEGIPSARQPHHAAAILRKEVGPSSKNKAEQAKRELYKTGVNQHANHPNLANVAFIPKKGRPVINAAPSRKLSVLAVQQMATERLRRALAPHEAAWISTEMDGGKISEPEAIQLLEALAHTAGEPRQVLKLEKA